MRSVSFRSSVGHSRRWRRCEASLLAGDRYVAAMTQYFQVALMVEAGDASVGSHQGLNVVDLKTQLLA
jgi:hypothetical protein